MQASSWLKSQDLFERSVLLNSSQREELLQRECEQDIELFEDVLRLLNAHDNYNGILHQVRYKNLTLTRKDMSNQLIGPYQVVSKLGSGGMGVVYKAFDIRLERYLALKFLPHNLTTDDRAKKRLLREAKAASALSHQHLCTVFDIEETDDGQVYIAMAYYDGKNFDALIDEGTLTLNQSVTAVRQIASGLIAAHAKSIIHRDIKPANLILNGNRGIKILDFGIAKFSNAQNTDTAIQGGTVAYMSPEHIRGEKLDLRTDIWSTAIILFELISGKKPFSGNTLPETMHKVLHDPTPRLSKFARGIPKQLDDVIYKALSKDINERHQSMTEFLADLDQIAGILDPNYRHSSAEISAADSLNTDNAGTTNLEINSQENSSALSNNQPVRTASKNAIELVCTAISMANYDHLNNTLEPVVFQQIVGLYLKGIKQRVSQQNGLIKTLVGNTIVCEFKYDPEYNPSSQRAIDASTDIHKYIADIAQANNINLDCFITITEISCSEMNILDCSKILSSIAKPMDIYASDAVYHSIKSTHAGIMIDSEISDALPRQATMWRLCDYDAAPMDDAVPVVSEPESIPEVEATSQAEPAQENTAAESLTEADVEATIGSEDETVIASAGEIPEQDLQAEAKQESVEEPKEEPEEQPAEEHAPAPTVEDKPAAILNSDDVEPSDENVVDEAESDLDITPVGDHMHVSEEASSAELSSGNKADIDPVPVPASATPEPEAAPYQPSYIVTDSFVGRSTLLTEIETTLADCIANSKTHMIHISGANGVGKTRLAAEIQAMAEHVGFTCHHQINVEFGADEGLQIFCKISKSILSKNCGEATNAELSLLDYAITNNVVGTDLVVYLYDILGLTPEKTLDAEPAATKHSTWIKQRNRVLQAIFSSAAETSPLMIFIDDLQWADSISVQSLIEIMSNCGNKPIVIVSTGDRNSLDIEPMLNKELQPSQFSVFELAALNQRQAEQLLAQTIELPVDGVDDLLRSANGMPLKINLMAIYYKISGKTDFPSSVVELVMVYLSTLPDEDIQALWAASTIGGIFSQTCIRYLINNQEYDCQRLIELGFISSYGRLYTFAHPLIYRAVYETIDDDTKRELHKDAAEWYAYVDYSIRAEHLDRAESDEAVTAYLEAASHLNKIFHLVSAQKYAKRGLELATTKNDETATTQLTELLQTIDQKLEE